jgi:hypothetical protein
MKDLKNIFVRNYEKGCGYLQIRSLFITIAELGPANDLFGKSRSFLWIVYPFFTPSHYLFLQIEFMMTYTIYAAEGDIQAMFSKRLREFILDTV